MPYPYLDRLTVADDRGVERLVSVGLWEGDVVLHLGGGGGGGGGGWGGMGW